MVGLPYRDRRESPVRSVERVLAVVLLALLGAYAVGTLAAGRVPPIRDLGVLAVHVALAVALVLPTVVLAHAGVGTRLGSASAPGRVEVGVAAVALGSLVAALAVSAVFPAVDALALLVLALAGVCLLSGLVLADRWRGR